MTAAQAIRGRFWRWLDDAAEAVNAAVARFSSRRSVRLVEDETGQFTADAGRTRKAADADGRRFQFKDDTFVGTASSAAAAALNGCRVELVLRPDRFVFQPLELPSRASEFLDGIVRAQIDRLTPWTAEQSAFGHTSPQDAGGGRIVVTVAATAKAMVTPYVRALSALGVRSVTVATLRSPSAPADRGTITVLEENAAGIDVQRVRRALLVVLLACGLIATGAVAAAAVIGDSLQARQDELARRIAERRSAAIAARGAAADPVLAAEQALAQRKNETPSTVIVLEVLSQILPDHTYVTELRIEGDRLRLTGVSGDVPSLIRLIEQSHHFTHATFFAPTTRAPSDPGDRFNIEARIAPVFSVRS